MHIPVATNLDLGAVKYETAETRSDRGVVLGDVGVEIVRCSNLVLCAVDEASQLVSLGSHASRLALSRCRDLAEGRLPASNGLRLIANELHNSSNRVIERSTTEQDDILPRLTLEFADVLLVLRDRERVGDVCAGEKNGTLVGGVGVEANEEAACALVVRGLGGSDRKAKSRREGLGKAGNALQLIGRVEAHELSLATVG